MNAGWPFAPAWALRDRRNVGGFKVQEIGDALARCSTALRAPLLPAGRGARARAPRNPGCRRRARAIATSADLPSPALAGKAGGTDPAVLQAHFEIAHQKGSLVHGASARQVAELAGVSWPTAYKAQRRLTKAGWLRRLQIGRGHEATTWRLRPGKMRNANTHHLRGA